MEVNTVCGIMYDVKAKAIIEALVQRHAKVEKKTLGERLAKVKAKATLADKVVVVEVDILGDKLSMLKRWWIHLLTGEKRWMRRPYATHLQRWTMRR